MELNVSVSEFIRSVVKKEIKKQHRDDIQTFIAQKKPIESLTDADATEYVQRLRGKSRIVHD